MLIPSNLFMTRISYTTGIITDSSDQNISNRMTVVQHSMRPLIIDIVDGKATQPFLKSFITDNESIINSIKYCRSLITEFNHESQSLHDLKAWEENCIHKLTKNFVYHIRNKNIEKQQQNTHSSLEKVENTDAEAPNYMMETIMIKDNKLTTRYGEVELQSPIGIERCMEIDAHFRNQGNRNPVRLNKKKVSFGDIKLYVETDDHTRVEATKTYTVEESRQDLDLLIEKNQLKIKNHVSILIEAFGKDSARRMLENYGHPKRKNKKFLRYLLCMN